MIKYDVIIIIIKNLLTLFHCEAAPCSKDLFVNSSRHTALTSVTITVYSNSFHQCLFTLNTMILRGKLRVQYDLDERDHHRLFQILFKMSSLTVFHSEPGPCPKDQSVPGSSVHTSVQAVTITHTFYLYLTFQLVTQHRIITTSYFTLQQSINATFSSFYCLLMPF